MTKMMRPASNHTCHIGYKCCEYDKRPARVMRRSQRRREAQDWKKQAA